jgi:hypothetical protein
MPLDKTGHTGPDQVSFSSAVDQAAQYRQLGFALIAALRAIGYTDARGSNSVNTGNAADYASGRITQASEVVFGTEASQAHSWVCMFPPVGKGNPGGGGEHTIQINFNNSNADTTPQNFDVYLARGTYVGGANGTTTTRPSILAGGFELTVLTLAWIPWAAATAGSFCLWTTEDGDILAGVKRDGVEAFDMYFTMHDDPINGIGNYTMCLRGNSSTSDILTSSSIIASQQRAMNTAGDAATTTITPVCTAWSSMSSFTSGHETVTSRVPMRDIEINANNSSGRILGLWPDVVGVPNNTVFNELDTEDIESSDPMIFRTIGDVAVPGDAAIT